MFIEKKNLLSYDVNVRKIFVILEWVGVEWDFILLELLNMLKFLRLY